MKHYYKINEISKLYNIGQDSLRYYEELGILSPKRGENRYRQYSTQDIYRLNIIKDMRNLGFSMAKIKEFIEHRSIENSLKMFEEEIQLIDDKIEQLIQMRSDMIYRKKEMLRIKELKFETFEIQRLPERKCVMLKATTDSNDNDFLFTKLSKEYEKNLFAIANFNTGCLIDMHDNVYTYQSVLILGDTLETYEFVIPEGTYLTLSYQGKKDQNFEHLKKMNAYMKEHGYQSKGSALELLIIDVHESAKESEYITQLQVRMSD